MNILLKILIVLNLLLAIAAIAFIYFVHDQREILKTQITESREHVGRMANSLKWGNYDKLPAELNKEGNVDLLGSWKAEPSEHVSRMRNNLTDYRLMRDGLTAMEKVAANRVENLEKAKLAWDAIDGRLEVTNQVLAVTRGELDDTREDLAEEENAHTDTKRQLEEEKDMVRRQKGEIESLNGQLADKEDTIAQRNETIEKMQADLDEVNAEAFDLTRQLEICRRGREGGVLSENQIGKVVAVEHDWNFVVLDVGREENITENMTAMIHRGDNLIGRVLISKASDNSSIGKIIPEFQVKGYRIEAGDGVMF